MLLGVDHGGRVGRLVFSDPPMCEPCAAVSLELCPYIARGRVPRRPPPAGVVPNAVDLGTDREDKPGWTWVLADGFTMIHQPRRGSRIFAAFRPGPVLAVRRFGYDQGGMLRELPARR